MELLPVSKVSLNALFPVNSENYPNPYSVFSHYTEVIKGSSIKRISTGIKIHTIPSSCIFSLGHDIRFVHQEIVPIFEFHEFEKEIEIKVFNRSKCEKIIPPFSFLSGIIVLEAYTGDFQIGKVGETKRNDSGYGSTGLS